MEFFFVFLCFILCFGGCVFETLSGLPLRNAKPVQFKWLDIGHWGLKHRNTYRNVFWKTHFINAYNVFFENTKTHNVFYTRTKTHYVFYVHITKNTKLVFLCFCVSERNTSIHKSLSSYSIKSTEKLSILSYSDKLTNLLLI